MTHIDGVAAVLGGAALVLLAGAAPVRAQIAVNAPAPAPEFVGGSWLNTPRGGPVTLASRKGKVTVVHFWTFG